MGNVVISFNHQCEIETTNCLHYGLIVDYYYTAVSELLLQRYIII